LSVRGPDPVAVPEAAPSGAGGGDGGAAAASRRIGVCGAVVGVVLAVWGSSFSVGRGGAGARGGEGPWRRPAGVCCGGARGGSTREGRSRAGRSRGASRVGSSVGGGLTGGAGGVSSTRGAVGAPPGEPMAATLGVSTTNTGFVRVLVHIDALMTMIAKNATW